MSPLYSKNGKIVIGGDGKFANKVCPEGCCGREPPGVCCNNEWHDTPLAQGECPPDIVGVCCSGENAPSGIWLPIPAQQGDGVCCNGSYYPPETSGTCCNNVWYSGTGECCDGLWHPANNPNEPCPEGYIYLKWGIDDSCCGCLPEQIMDYRTDPSGVLVDTLTVKEELCCPGGVLPDALYECPGKCNIITYDEFNNPTCTCQDLTSTQCYSQGSIPGDCLIPCCTEADDGSVGCNMVKQEECVCPGQADACDKNCSNNDVCLGACFDPNDINQCAQVKQEDCTQEGFLWAGLGVACNDPLPQSGDFRSPFTSNGCETVISKGAGLMMSQPYMKRMPPFANTLRATITGSTDSPIRIHGTLLGVEDQRCDIDHSFTMCGNSFNIEPVPCDSNFKYLDVSVCWEEEPVFEETQEFSGCNNITVNLGNCDYDCSTTLDYSLAGHTSNAQIVFNGSGTIRASGIGSLVLTGNIAPLTSCSDVLILESSGVAINEITGDISGTNVNVEKRGPGVWKLTGSKTYSGQLKVLEGTVIIGSSASSNSSSPFGSVSPLSIPPIVGSNDGPTAMLIVGGSDIDRNFTIASGITETITIGNTNGGLSVISGFITLGSNVTLQASTSGTINFTSNSLWDESPIEITINSIGNEGTVMLTSTLSEYITKVTVVTGTLSLNSLSNRIRPTTPVVVENATINIATPDKFQTFNSLIVNENLIVTGEGTLNIVDLTGSGDIDIQKEPDYNGETGVVLHPDSTGTNSLTGTITVTEGYLTLNKIVSNPESLITSVTFTPSTLTVNFSSNPDSGDQFVLLAGPTGGTYTPSLVGTSATGTYNSTTSTLTIN